MGEEKVVPERFKRPGVDVNARDKFYEKVAVLEYRQLMVEIPAKMMFELGRIALRKKKPFNEFIEEILEEYLERQGIKWRDAPERPEEWLRHGPGATESNRDYVKKKLGIKFEE